MTATGTIRVVSLVPSLTEAVAVTFPGALVGATAWCTHPSGLDVPRLGGTKNPNLAAIRDLAPDLVLMDVDENRRADADALLAAGLAVHTTHPHTVDEALDQLGDLLRRLGAGDDPGWLRAARTAWAALPPPARRRRAVIPVWRRPWVVVGGGTFASDVLRRLGIENLFDGVTGGATADRYPRPSLHSLREAAPELVVLPDEPYRFTPTDGPEAFAGVPCALVSGRHLTWYGPSLAEAPEVLAAQLARPLTVDGTDPAPRVSGG